MDIEPPKPNPTDPQNEAVSEDMVTSEEDDDEHETVDVREELEEILEDKSINFNAAFSSTQTFQDAPNPGLHIAELGVIGLPLGHREAEAIKTCAVYDPAKGVVDNTWEVDGRLVRFSNPRFSSFVDKAVADACKVMGIDTAGSKPRCELRRLFTGGTAYLSHGGFSLSHVTSAHSLHDTCTIAWYAGVTQKLEPIASGYRLSLSFHLIHPSKNYRHTLEKNALVMQRLSCVFKSWSHDDGAPEKIVHRLAHKYPSNGLKASVLKGVDADKVSLLSILAKQHDFRIGLAIADCYLVGPADDDGEAQTAYEERQEMRSMLQEKYGKYWKQMNHEEDAGSEEVDESPEQFNFEEIDEREINILHFVDLEGEIISKSLAFDDELEGVPLDFTEGVENDEPYKQKYQGYQNYSAGNLERWYHRAVLVIWPSWANTSVLYSGSAGVTRMCKALLDPPPPPGALDPRPELARILSSRAAQNPQLVVTTLSEYSRSMNRPDEWLAYVKKFLVEHKKSSSEVFGRKLKLGAVETFGFVSIREGFDAMLQSERDDMAKLQFLDGLGAKPWSPTVTNEIRVAEVIAELNTWAVEKRRAVLISMKLENLTTAQCPVLLKAAGESGGATFVRTCMLPQLEASASVDFLVSFAKAIFAYKKFPASLDTAEVIRSLLSTAISKAIFWKGRAMADAKEYIKLCSQFHCSDLIGRLIDRLIDPSDLSQEDLQRRSRELLLPFLISCAEYERSNLGRICHHRFRRLHEATIPLYLDSIGKDPSALQQGELTRLIEATVVDGDPRPFMETVAPRLEALTFPPAQLRMIAHQLRAEKARFVFPPDYTGRTLDDVISSFARSYISQINLADSYSLVGTLDWLVSANQIALLALFVENICHPTKLSNLHTVVYILVPSLPQIRAWGVKHGQLEILAPAFQHIMFAWLDKFLKDPSLPNAALESQLKDLKRKWGCTCPPCVTAREFVSKIGSTDNTSCSLNRIGAPKRKHVEQVLTHCAKDLVSYSMIATTPQGLKVQRSNALQQRLQWQANQTKGRAILKGISESEDELKRLLGTEYQKISQAVGNMPVVAENPPSAPSASDTPATGSTSVTEIGGASSSTSLSNSAGAPAQNVSDLQPRLGDASGVGGQPPAKKRKVIPVNEEDIIDLT